MQLYEVVSRVSSLSLHAETIQALARIDCLSIADRLLWSSSILICVLAIRLAFDIKQIEEVYTNKLFPGAFMCIQLAVSIIGLVAGSMAKTRVNSKRLSASRRHLRR